MKIRLLPRKSLLAPIRRKRAEDKNADGGEEKESGNTDDNSPDGDGSVKEDGAPLSMTPRASSLSPLRFIRNRMVRTQKSKRMNPTAGKNPRRPAKKLSRNLNLTKPVKPRRRKLNPRPKQQTPLKNCPTLQPKLRTKENPRQPLKTTNRRLQKLLLSRKARRTRPKGNKKANRFCPDWPTSRRNRSSVRRHWSIAPGNQRIDEATRRDKCHERRTGSG